MVGTTLGGRYTLTRVVGVGGHGAVFEARHVLLDQVVAVKVLDIDDTRPVAEARFLREARTAARVDHPGVVRVFDLGRDDDAGCLYLAQELVRGTTLRAWMDEHLLASPREALALLGPVMEGLAAAHAVGVVHRDVKPENILLAASPQGTSPRLIDFGVAFLVAHDERLLTGDGVVGTPAYMAPEQARGARDLDARVDIWALGVILYELLLGRRPYDAEGARALLASLAQPEPVDFARHAPKASPALCAVLTRALAPHPDGRFATVLAMRDALAACPETRDDAARSWSPRDPLATLTTSPELPAPVRPPLRPRIPLRLLVLAAGVCVATVAALGASRAHRPRVQQADARRISHNEPPHPSPTPRPSPTARPLPAAVVAPTAARDAGAASPPGAHPTLVRTRTEAPRGRAASVQRAAHGANGAPILAPPGVDDLP